MSMGMSPTGMVRAALDHVRSVVGQDAPRLRAEDEAASMVWQEAIADVQHRLAERQTAIAQWREQLTVLARDAADEIEQEHAPRTKALLDGMADYLAARERIDDALVVAAMRGSKAASDLAGAAGDNLRHYTEALIGVERYVAAIEAAGVLPPPYAAADLPH